MIKTKKIACALALCSIFTTALQAQKFAPLQSDDHCSVRLNLKEVKDDKLKVQMIPVLIKEDSVEFHMPRIIPGTYDIHNYGRYLSEFKAYTASGDSLKTKKLDINRWRIYTAQKLYRIEYLVDDTYDTPEPSNIFEPSGTSLEDSVFLLNNFGFIGYINGYKDYTYHLEIIKPKGFYGSTALEGELSDTLDLFEVKDYFTVHDNPIMYSIPDTATRMVGGTEVIVSVYSPRKTVNAAECMKEISAVLDAAAEYLGGELPADKYCVIIYTVSLDNASNSYGALEHHTSTVLYMPEFPGPQFYSGVRDITSHEFFHIVTPLGIHSQQIADFNFIDPDMSRHIWLYEGVTEYNSHLVQVRSNIYSTEEFLEVMRNKLVSASQFNQYVPITQASKYTLTFYKDQYYNFYQKGAVAGMALDLKLRSLSGGEYGLRDLLGELGAVYHQDTFFVDDQLFDIITERTYPEMEEFFARHFEGAEPFPLSELLEYAGIAYYEGQEEARIEGFGVDFGYNFNTNRIKVSDVNEMTSFARDLGLQVGDELIEFNGKEINLGNINEIIGEFFRETKAGEKVKVLVARPDGDSGFDKEKLKAKARIGTVVVDHVFEILEEPNPEQARFRQLWINQ